MDLWVPEPVRCPGQKYFACPAPLSQRPRGCGAPGGTTWTLYPPHRTGTPSAPVSPTALSSSPSARTSSATWISHCSSPANVISVLSSSYRLPTSTWPSPSHPMVSFHISTFITWRIPRHKNTLWYAIFISVNYVGIRPRLKKGEILYLLTWSWSQKYYQVSY